MEIIDLMLKYSACKYTQYFYVSVVFVLYVYTWDIQERSYWFCKDPYNPYEIAMIPQLSLISLVRVRV